MLEVMDVDLHISGSDCGLHAVAAASELCADNDPTGRVRCITWEHNQLQSHLQRCLERLEAINPFLRKVQRPSGTVRASIQTPIFLNGQQTWLGASNVVKGTTKPAPTSLKQVFQGKESHRSVKL